MPSNPNIIMGAQGVPDTYSQDAQIAASMMNAQAQAQKNALAIQTAKRETEVRNTLAGGQDDPLKKALALNGGQDALSAFNTDVRATAGFEQEQGERAMGVVASITGQIDGLPQAERAQAFSTLLAQAGENDPSLGITQEDLVYDPERLASIQAQVVGYKEQSGRDATLSAAALKEGNVQARHMDNLDKPPMQINVGTGEKWSMKALAQGGGTRYTDAIGFRDAAYGTLNTVQQMRAVDPETGAMRPVLGQIGGYLRDLGVSDERLAKMKMDPNSSEKMLALANSATLDKMAAQKGPQTESDMLVIRATVARMGNTPEAFEFLLNAQESNALQQIARTDYIEERVTAFGRQDDRARTGLPVAEAERDWTKLWGKTPRILQGTHGEPMFYHQWEQVIKNSNPDQELTQEQLVKAWKGKFKNGR